eukprot:SAG11_NODE_16381_length_549_cov_0.546667_1_plen_52_part_10
MNHSEVGELIVLSDCGSCARQRTKVVIERRVDRLDVLVNWETLHVRPRPLPL